MRAFIIPGFSGNLIHVINVGDLAHAILLIHWVPLASSKIMQRNSTLWVLVITKLLSLLVCFASCYLPIGFNVEKSARWNQELIRSEFVKSAIPVYIHWCLAQFMSHDFRKVSGLFFESSYLHINIIKSFWGSDLAISTLEFGQCNVRPSWVDLSALTYCLLLAFHNPQIHLWCNTCFIVEAYPADGQTKSQM